MNNPDKNVDDYVYDGKPTEEEQLDPLECDENSNPNVQCIDERYRVPDVRDEMNNLADETATGSLTLRPNKFGFK